MRVLHVNAGNLYGGVESLLVTLARHRASCPEMALHFAVCFPGRLREELTATEAPVHDLGPVGVSRPWTVLRARRRLHKLIRHTRFDAVVCHNSWALALFGPAVRRARAPLVFQPHDRPHGTHWLERWARRVRPDLVLANSEFTRAAVATAFPAARCEVWRPPVPPPPAMDRGRARAEVRAELGTAPRAVVVVQVARLERLKGQAILLDALGRLRDRPGWELWLVGGPQRPEEETYLAELQALARQLGIADRARFLGQRSDVPRLLAAADVYCQANIGPESFGITLIEALYAGLPVVTTALGGPAEFVDETCGRLVPPNHPAELADQLARLIDDSSLRAQLGAGGPARARELSDPVRQVRQLDTILTALAVPCSIETLGRLRSPV